MRVLSGLITMFAVACSGVISNDPSAPAGADGGAGGDPALDSADAGSATPDAYVGTGNRHGIGLVGPGDALDWDLSRELVGEGGYVRLVLPGITRDTQAPDPAWVAAVAAIYARGMVPVLRLAPPWGDLDVRYDSDDPAHTSFLALAQAHRRVVEQLPRHPTLPLWVEIHNEPNLCYEWTCHAGDGASIGYATMAHEYAAMLRDTADAMHAIGDPRILVMNAGLAPGGAVSCDCGGDGFSPGITSREFLAEMKAAVPDLFDHLDGFASHPYPAQGEGWGFFVPYDQAGPGLRYFERELEIVARDLPVFITETGWTASNGSREQIASWTVQAYRELWLTDERIAAVMPFMLRDPSWDAFGWVAPSGAHYPVFDAVKAERCETVGGCP